MASKHGLRIIGPQVESFEEYSSAAPTLEEYWRRERQRQLTRQLTINAEVRKRWIAAEPIETGRW
jgi:hypothetical protein